MNAAAKLIQPINTPITNKATDAILHSNIKPLLSVVNIMPRKWLYY